MSKKEPSVEALRKAWDEGKQSGIAGRFDMRAIIRDAKIEKRKAVKKGDALI